MKALATIFLLVLSISAAVAQSSRLFLIPLETSIKKRGSVGFDVFVYNDSAKPTKVPSLELFSAVYVLRDTTGKTSPRVESSAKIATHPAEEHTLAPKRIEQRRIKMDIPAEPGDLVEVYIEIGRKSVLRSNSVLLFCPVEEKATEPASSPKAAITPEGKS